MRDELSLTLDEDDFIAAYRLPARPRRLAVLVPLLALILVFLIVTLLIQFPEARLAFAESPMIIGQTGAVILAASLLLLLLIATPALRRRAARSTLNDHPGMRDPMHYTIDPDYFHVRSTYAEACYPWAQLWDWRECERLLVVMPTPRNFYLIPKSGIDPAVLDRLRSYLARARRRASAS